MAEFSAGPTQLPPLASVAATLRSTTERLARELAQPGSAPPEWSAFEWRTARAVAVMHGVSGLLATTLLWRGPDSWAEFLSEQREHVACRQLRLAELRGSLAERCRHEGIPVQALKGSALALEGLYEPGERPMADVDLLTEPRHAAGAATILESLGLRESHRTFKHRVFEPANAVRPRAFGEHRDNAVKVELHERICERLPYHLVDITSLVSPPQAQPGVNPYASRAALMAHLLLHAGGDIVCRTLRLIHLHDIVLLARRLTLGDWQQLLEWHGWWAWPPLVLAERYYGPVAPEAVATALRSCCPPLLRRACGRYRLSDVSSSDLWLEAFPGIEWSRSVKEAVNLIARRIVPSPETRADRKFALATDPSLEYGDWGGLSQSRRILRGLRAPAPRPWPLHYVRMAAAQPA